MKRMLSWVASLLLMWLWLPWHAAAQSSIDTLSFRLTGNNEGEVALLHWADLGSGISYDVYRHLPQEEGFQLLLTTDTVEVSDTIARSVCHDTVAYYVSAWRGDTFYLSNRIAMFFSDPNPTAACTLGLASVECVTQQLRLTWQPSPDGDVMGYVVHKGTNGSHQGSLWQPYDTVWGRENTSYLCHGLDLTAIHAFRLFAFDSCFQASPLTSPYQNMVMNATVAACSRHLDVQWTSYINMPSEVAAYEVLLQVDGGAWQTIATHTIHQPQQCSYELPAEAGAVRVAVRAVSGSGVDTAWSNMASLQLSGSSGIGYMTIDKATVSGDNGAVVLLAHVDSTYLTESYALYRAAPGASWTRCALLPFTGSGTLHYADRSASPSTTAYRYRIGVTDSCHNGETFSNEANNVLLVLDGDSSGDETVRLHWSSYDGWDEAASYELLRRSEGDSVWHSLGYGTGHDYTDDLTLIGNMEGALLYKVVAHGPDTLQSNTVRYAAEARVWVPNAFTPLRQPNALFCIQGRNIAAEGYELFLFSRTGQQLFHTTNRADCWDGTLLGKPLPQGAYVYLLTYRDAAGHTHHTTGTVLLLP